VTAVLRAAGCDISGGAGDLICRSGGTLQSVEPIRTAPYPGFPTDAQAIAMAALLKSRGTTVFEENLFTSRYRHVDELTRLGGCIRVSGRTAVVMGVERLRGAAVRAADLRGGAALVRGGAGGRRTQRDCRRAAY
jgi:UDP-N-acetylglucosamine 1-carboxyvinyltransferase